MPSGRAARGNAAIEGPVAVDFRVAEPDRSLSIPTLRAPAPGLAIVSPQEVATRRCFNKSLSRKAFRQTMSRACSEWTQRFGVRSPLAVIPASEEVRLINKQISREQLFHRVELVFGVQPKVLALAEKSGLPELDWTNRTIAAGELWWCNAWWSDRLYERVAPVCQREVFGKQNNPTGRRWCISCISPDCLFQTIRDTRLRAWLSRKS
jgi:hypothetical protein